MSKSPEKANEAGHDDSTVDDDDPHDLSHSMYMPRMEIVFPRGVTLGVESPTVDKYGDPVDKADRWV